MDPTGPSQPNLDTAYDQPSNPVSQTDYEKQDSTSTGASIQRSDPTIEKRERGDVPVPSSHDGGPTPSSLGRGARDDKGDAGESVCRTMPSHVSGTIPALADSNVIADG